MQQPKKIRLTFSEVECQHIYAALGAKAGMLRDEAAVRNLRPSEYVAKVAEITYIQDRIFEALNPSEGPKPQEELSL